MQRKFDKRLILSSVLILIAIPLTIAFGVVFLHDRKYYFISIAILIYTILPFLLVFEQRGPRAREIILVCSLSAIAVIGRAAFFMLPHFKPVAAIVIISAVCLGPESGFLVGALSGFVSNFFYGQGPWTPWQMFSFGIIGFLAGVLHRKGILKLRKLDLCVFGGLSTFLVYGGLMNFGSVLMFSSTINKGLLLAAYLSGIPFDLVHAASTVLFLFFIEEPMIEKITRIRVKYGLINESELLKDS
ncbi:MAG: ECF transporter S component [Eubacteriales bacterium]|jgi:energy-coupling factor transport system substrate-specific component